jgi:hypothetical protein
MERKSVGGERIVIILLSLVRSRDPRRFQLGDTQSLKPLKFNFLPTASKPIKEITI